VNVRRTSQTWQEVERLHEGPMLDLARFLASSRYASALFPRAAPDVLHISRRRDASDGDDELKIAFDRALQRFMFTYSQRPGDPKPWSRDCGATEWQAVLERILHKRLDWFHEG